MILSVFFVLSVAVVVWDRLPVGPLSVYRVLQWPLVAIALLGLLQRRSLRFPLKSPALWWLLGLLGAMICTSFAAWDLHSRGDGAAPALYRVCAGSTHLDACFKELLGGTLLGLVGLVYGRRCLSDGSDSAHGLWGFYRVGSVEILELGGVTAYPKAVTYDEEPLPAAKVY